MTKILFGFGLFCCAPVMNLQAATTSARQCMVDICGPETNYLGTAAKGPFAELVPLDVQTFLNVELDTRFEKLYTLNENRIHMSMNIAEALRASLTSTPLSSEQLTVFAMLTVYQKIIPQIDTLFDPQTSGHKITINFDKARAQFPDIETELLRVSVNFLNSFYASTEFASYRTLDSFNYDVYKQAVTASTIAAMKEMTWSLYTVPAFLTQALEIQARLGVFAFQNADIDIFKKVMRQQNLNESEKKHFMSALASLYSLRGFLKLANDSTIAVDIARLKLNLDDILKLNQWDERKQNLTKILGNPTEYQQIKNRVLKICHEDVTAAIAAAPSQLAQKKANELMAQVKIAAKESAAVYLTGPALAGAVAAIDRVQFATPQSLDTVKKTITDALDIALKQAGGSNEKISAAITGNADTNALTFTILGQSLGTSTDVIILKIKDTCDSLRPAVFEDKSWNSLGVIQMGWQTAHFHEIGAGIIAHEIGHVVSSAVLSALNANAQAYVETRQCSTNQHRAIIGSQSFLGDVSQYQEEDWADSFAATTIKVLNKTWPYAKNYACAFVPFDDDSKYGDLNLAELTGNDTHSLSFARVLQTQSNLGKPLPISCQAAFNARDFATMSRSCAK